MFMSKWRVSPITIVSGIITIISILMVIMLFVNSRFPITHLVLVAVLHLLGSMLIIFLGTLKAMGLLYVATIDC